MARGQPDLMNIPHAGLTPGPNYRTSFDDSTIAELADSIATHGLLQNLVVTSPIDPAGRWIIISGERRWRAIGLLIDQQRWPAERNIPCQLREDLSGDAAGIRIAALIENLQREDVNPMEEAEAYAAIRSLAPDRFSTETIATQIGKTTRYVQQRLALAERLAPAIKEKVRAGTITVTQAREIAIASNPKAQAKLAEQASNTYGNRPEDLRRVVMGSLFPLAAAKFERSEYAGEVVDVDGADYAADRAAALKLQAAWAQAEAERIGATFLEADHYWAPGHYQHGKCWRTAHTPAEKKKAVTLIVLTRQTGAVERYPNMTDARPAAASPPRLSAEEKADRAALDAHRKASHAIAERFEASVPDPDREEGGAQPFPEMGDGLAARLGAMPPDAMGYVRRVLAAHLCDEAFRGWSDVVESDAAAFVRALGIDLPPEIRVASPPEPAAPEPTPEPAVIAEPASEPRSPKKKKAA